MSKIYNFALSCRRCVYHQGIPKTMNSITQNYMLDLLIDMSKYSIRYYYCHCYCKETLCSILTTLYHVK